MSDVNDYLKLQEKFIRNHINDLLDASFDGILIADSSGMIVFENRAYEELSGIKRAKLVGKNLEELIHVGVLEGAVALEAARTKATRTTMHHYKKTGKSAMVTANPVFDQSGDLGYVIVNFRDITQLNSWYEDLGNSFDHKLCDNPLYLKYDQANLPDYGMLIQNKLMKDCMNKAIRVAEFDTHVLILGESGCGKTRMAEIIHKESLRSKGPYISVNCGSIPENLFESELYGYDKGAFTGASSQGKKGLFELASMGTLVLDEIGELPMTQQVKLLKAIEEKQIYKVGCGIPLNVNVRIIAISNRDLKTMVNKNLFRRDLYFRLNVVSLLIPSLRDRIDEIPCFTKYFFNKFNNKYGMSKFPSSSLIQRLCQYDYKGNVRELKNMIESLFIMAPQNRISADDLDSCLGDKYYDLVFNHYSDGDSLRGFMDKCEKDIIKKTVKESETYREAYMRLGISKASFWRKYNKYELGKKMVIEH